MKAIPALLTHPLNSVGEQIVDEIEAALARGEPDDDSTFVAALDRVLARRSLDMGELTRSVAEASRA